MNGKLMIYTKILESNTRALNNEDYIILRDFVKGLIGQEDKRRKV